MRPLANAFQIVERGGIAHELRQEYTGAFYRRHREEFIFRTECTECTEYVLVGNEIYDELMEVLKGV